MRGGVFDIIQSCSEAFVLSPVLQRGQVPRAEELLVVRAARALEHGTGAGDSVGTVRGLGRGDPSGCVTVIV